MKNNKMLDVISKIMNEEIVDKSGCQDCFLELKKIISEDLPGVLDEGFYNDSSSVISKLNNLCDDMEIFNTIPALAGKGIVNIFTGIEGFRSMMGNMLLLPEGLEKNNGIPLLLTGGREAKEDTITAVTYANKRIEVTLEEYNCIVEEIKDASIECRRLVQVFIIESSRYYDYLCLCILPDKMLDDAGLAGYFLQKAEKNFLFGMSAAKIRQKMLALENINVDIICHENDVDKIKELLTQRQLQRIGAFYDENTAFRVISGFDCHNRNYLVVNKIEDVLLDVMVYYQNCICRFKSTERMLNEDSLHLPNGVVKEQVSRYADKMRKQRHGFEEALANYETTFKKILDKAYKFQKEIQQALWGAVTMIQMHYPDQALESIYFKYLNMHDFESARECVRCMIDNHYEKSEIFELFLKYSEDGEISKKELDRIAGSQAQDSSVARIQIELSGVMGYTPEYLTGIVDYITDLRYAKEYYIYAEKLIRQGKYSEAAENLKISFEEGYADAGKRLLDMSMTYPECDVTLHQLADMIIPDANFCLAIDEFDGDETDAKVNLKIAAAKKHREAIEVIADILFEECRNLSMDDMEKKANQENVFNIINLYEYLNRIQTDSKYLEHIGLMYCKLRDFKRALEYLKDIGTPEACYQCALMYYNGDGTAVSPGKALEYFRKCGNYLDASILAVKVSGEIRRAGNNKQNSGFYKKDYLAEREVITVERSGHCFITTAACMALNETKDCEQLNVLRWFRDKYISDGGMGDLLISEYYRIGPMIVSGIDNEWNPVAVYSILWKYYIEPSCEAIRNHRWDCAKNIYIDMVKHLCEKYKIGVNSEIAGFYNIKI